MQETLRSADFLDKKAAELSAFKAQNTQTTVSTKVEPEVIKTPTIIENGLKDAVKELSKNGNEPAFEVTNPEKIGNKDEKTRVDSVKAGDTEGEKEEIKAEVPTQKRVDLDKNKEKEATKQKAEVDSDTKAHLEWLTKDEESETSLKEEKPNYEKEIETYKSKVQEYESVLNDDYVKAVIEFRKSGGVDLTELNAQLGIADPNRLTIEDFYRQKAEARNLKGDELTDAVNESIDKYNALPKLDQLEILDNFKNTVRSKTEEKLKSFSVNSQAQRREMEQIENSALVDIKKEVEDKVGKKWKGLLIDEKMGKDLSNEAAKYLMPIMENGKLIGFDTKNAVRLAILDKYEKKLLKANWDLAKVSAYDEAIEERNRPNENMTSNQIVVNAPNDLERISKQRREEKERQRNRGRN